MTVRYQHREGRLWPIYACQRDGIACGEPACQVVHGGPIDEAIGALLLEAVCPRVLEVSLAVQRELEARAEHADKLRKMAVERARHDAELARRRYMRVDPDNRLVAASLEAEWNDRMRALADAQHEYERQSRRAATLVDAEARARVLALATDFPRLWRDPATPDRERKRMVRLLIEDVTLQKGPEIAVHVRFKGGATRSLLLPRPLKAWELRQTSAEVVAEIDRLLDDYTDGQVAKILNERDRTSGTGRSFTRLIIRRIREHYGLRCRFQRLRDRGMLTLDELAARLGVQTCTIKVWRRAGLVLGHAYSDRNDYLFEPPGDDAPVRYKYKGISANERARRDQRTHAQTTDEVQCEA